MARSNPRPVAVVAPVVASQVSVFFINNDGGGFADHIAVPAGTTVLQLFKTKIGERSNPGDYVIRVNRETVASDAILEDGDRVSVTPTKVSGANA